MAEIQLDLSKGISLDLSKGDFVNLTKNHIDSLDLRAGCGWNSTEIHQQRGLIFKRDYVSYKDVDLDLIAVLEDEKGQLLDRIFFHHRHGPGLILDQDDRSGSVGKIDINYVTQSPVKDNENIYINLRRVPREVKVIKLAVAIYDRNTFRDVTDAYCKLVDETNGRVLCSFRMSENGGENTCVHLANLKRMGNDWIFEAVGKYSRQRFNEFY